MYVNDSNCILRMVDENGGNWMLRKVGAVSHAQQRTTILPQTLLILYGAKENRKVKMMSI